MKDAAKTGWSVVPLATACETVSTGPFGSLLGKKDYVEDGVPVVNPIDIIGGKIQSVSIKRVSTETSERLRSYKMQPDDIVVARRGELGRCARIMQKNDGWLCGTGSFFVRPSKLILAEFLSTYIGSPAAIEFFSAASTGATMPNISNKTLSNLPIPLPPLEEQQRIVTVLNEAFEGLNRARAHAEANLQNARELFALAFEHELLKHKDTSTKTTMGEVCTGFEYGTSAKSQTEGKMPVLRMGNLQSGEIDWGDLVYTDSDVDIEKLKLNDGDVLFNRTNSLEHVGKTAIYRGDMPAIFAGYLIRVHHDRRTLLPEFLNMFLNSKSAREYGRSISGKSVNQANISASKLKTYPIILPSVEVQEEIVERMERLRGPLKDLESSYEVKIQDTDDLRKSLLQKAFAGELT